MAKNGRAIAIRVTAVICICIVVVLAGVAAHSVYARSRQGLHLSPASNQASGVCTSWYVSPGQNPSSSTNLLADIAAISPSNVWAVGSYYSSSAASDQALFEHFNGSSWSVVPGPATGTKATDLQNLAVVSSSDIWAVGSQSTSANLSTLVEHWDGSQWSVVPSPNGVDPSESGNYLTGVAAVSSDDVWAVGYYVNAYPSSGNSPILEHWNGTSWTIVTSPAVSSSTTVLTAVTAVAANDVWVVGSYRDSGSGTTSALFENWNGTSWTVVPAANSGWDDSEPQAVTAISANDIWAVGYGGVPGNPSYQSLTEHWNGSTWSVVPSPNGSPAFLKGAASLGSNDVWAVGYTGVPGPIYREPGLMRWNGVMWSVVPTPNLATYSSLMAISALSPTNLWAVGSDLVSPGYQVVIEHYNPRIAFACGAP